MKKQKVATEWIDEKRGPHTLRDIGYKESRTEEYDPGHKPVILVEYQDSYGIVNGRHRVMAAKNNNVKNIPAIVLDPEEFDQLEKKYDLDGIENYVCKQI